MNIVYKPVQTQKNTENNDFFTYICHKTIKYMLINNAIHNVLQQILKQYDYTK